MSKPEPRGLSRGAEELAVLLAQRRERPFDCDVLVIGSGYGGAVAAARLAGRPGADVWLVERGLEHTPGRFPSRFSELPGHVRFSMQDGEPPRGRDEGLFDVRLGSKVCALLGNGLGGGSLINAGVMAEPDAAVFEAGWPAGINAEVLQPAYRRAREMLDPRAFAPADLPRKYRVLDAVGGGATPCELTLNATAAPIHTPAGVKLPPCTQCGDCMTGCNVGAKASLDTNYLAHAARLGVPMFCGVSVSRIVPGSQGAGWQVEWHYTMRKLRLTQPDAGCIRARHVVLAAGSLGSTEILLRSAPALGLTSPKLGRHFSINGDTLTAGLGSPQHVGTVADAETDPATPGRHVGPTITGMVRVPPRSTPAKGFVTQEFAVPAALRWVFAEVTATRQVFDWPPAPGQGEPGADPYAATDAAVDRTALFGLMGRHAESGQLRLIDAEHAQPRVDRGVLVEHPRLDASLFNDMADWLSEAWTTQGGASVLPASKLFFELGPMVTVHPLGGLPMADTGEAGVVNAFGQVFRGHGSEVHESLVVLDGSIVPTSLGINPAFTIAALAEHAMEHLARQWLGAVGVQPVALSRPLQPRIEQPSGDTTWVIRERLQGRCEIGGQVFWARLEMRFAPVPGFARALQLTRRRLGVESAELKLYREDIGVDEFSFDEDAGRLPDHTARLTGSLLLFEPLTDPRNDDGPTDPQAPVTLRYQLSIQASDSTEPWLAAGARLDAVKQLNVVPAGDGRSPLREASEADVRLSGQPVGRWALDLADLAERREPLLSIAQLDTMPDALSDLGALAMYVLRRALPRMLSALASTNAAAESADLTARYPGRYADDGPQPQVIEGQASTPGGPLRTWRLSRYAGQGVPVVLIHGLGTSGSSFTHPAIGRNLARVLHESGRDVWVLDVRSSIGNEAWRRARGSAHTTVEEVALADLPPAVEDVCRVSGHQQVDVVAHCMGAVMFVLATLGGPRRAGLGARVRSAVLSQVGPRVRLSPFNLVRGFVGGYLQELLRIEELDATPTGGGSVSLLTDALLSAFPYPDGDADATLPPEVRAVRHRADAIFGQLFELPQMEATTLNHLPELFGWVKVPMLAQAIHFARQEMLTDGRGRNAVLRRDAFRDNFTFPVLMLHGRRNRVFDWRGSLRSLELIRRVRGVTVPPPAERAQDGSFTRYGGEAEVELVVLHAHGHLDCMIGQRAHKTVFPHIARFLAAQDTRPVRPRDPQSQRVTREPEPPWLGPMLGWMQWRQRWLHVNVVVHASQRRAFTNGFVVVPMTRRAGSLQPRLESARWSPWPGKPGDDVREAALTLRIDPAALPGLADTFALVTLHQDVPLEGTGQPASVLVEVAGGTVTYGGSTKVWDESTEAAAHGGSWLGGSETLIAEVRTRVGAWIDKHARTDTLEHCLFHLMPKVIDAVDAGDASDRPQRLCFALASCQYPPGLLDRQPAQASYRRLLADAGASDGPQLLLLAGDQVYADATAGVFDAGAMSANGKQTAARYDRIYELNWGLPAFRRLAARLPVYPILDDHEVGDDWQGTHAPSALDRHEVEQALAAYRRFQLPLAPQRRLSAAGTQSYVAFPAGVPLFVLDTRTARSARTAHNVSQAVLVADADLQALCAQLGSAPRAAVKLVMSSVPLLPPERSGAPAERLRSDSWSGFPASASALLRHIRDRRIERVVLLAGDSHLSSVTSLRFDNGISVVSVVSSGSYAPWPFSNQRPDEVQLQGRVSIGPPGREVTGELTLHALSTASGYAVVTVEPATGGAVALRVSLRDSRNGSVECKFPLDLHPT